jgi:hypothetical protein
MSKNVENSAKYSKMKTSILHKKLINMLLFSDCKRDIIKEENKSENGGNHYGNFSYRRRRLYRQPYSSRASECRV